MVHPALLRGWISALPFCQRLDIQQVVLPEQQTLPVNTKLKQCAAPELARSFGMSLCGQKLVKNCYSLDFLQPSSASECNSSS